MPEDSQKHDFTVIVGVDGAHLWQVAPVMGTWLRHKPDIFNRPFVVFYDVATTYADAVRGVLPGCIARTALLVPWGRPQEAQLVGEGRWYAPQRQLMLAGFVHVPAAVQVGTPYWMKLDLDVVALPGPTHDPGWLVCSDVVGHSWGYTKPPGQMKELDDWCEKAGVLSSCSPLGLVPVEGESTLKHRRICSFASFYRTYFTEWVAEACTRYGGPGYMPVPSQDGLHWYMAQRCRPSSIVYADMKSIGWKPIGSKTKLMKEVEVSMCLPG